MFVPIAPFVAAMAASRVVQSAALTTIVASRGGIAMTGGLGGAPAGDKSVGIIGSDQPATAVPKELPRSTRGIQVAIAIVGAIFVLLNGALIAAAYLAG